MKDKETQDQRGGSLRHVLSMLQSWDDEQRVEEMRVGVGERGRERERE